MLPAIEKDLIQEIIYNQDYDWSFVLENPVTVRPKGETLFVACLYPPEGRHSKIVILNNNGKYTIVVHIQLKSIKDQKLIRFENLLSYQRISIEKGIDQETDLENMYYNVSYSFQIDKSTWIDIKDFLKNTSIPLLPYGLKEPYKRSVMILTSVGHINCKWNGSSPQIKPLNEFLDYLLNFSLQKVHSAYLINQN